MTNIDTDILIIGAGPAGLVACEFTSVGKDVTIIGGRHILVNSFDADMAIIAESIMKSLKNSMELLLFFLL